MAVYLVKSLRVRCSSRLFENHEFKLFRFNHCWRRTLTVQKTHTEATFSNSKHTLGSRGFNKQQRKHTFTGRKKQMPLNAVNVDKDVLVYTSDPGTKRLSRGASLAFAVGAVSFFDLAYALIFPPKGAVPLEPINESAEKKDNLISRSSIKLQKYDKYAAAAFIVFGLTCAVVSFNVSRKVVQMLIVRSGGDFIELYTSSIFGRLRKAVIPVEEVCGIQHRLSNQRMTKLRVKHRRYPVFFLDGTYHEPHVFDHLVNVQRIL